MEVIQSYQANYQSYIVFNQNIFADSWYWLLKQDKGIQQKLSYTAGLKDIFCGNFVNGAGWEDLAFVFIYAGTVPSWMNA